MPELTEMVIANCLWYTLLNAYLMRHPISFLIHTISFPPQPYFSSLKMLFPCLWNLQQPKWSGVKELVPKCTKWCLLVLGSREIECPRVASRRVRVGEAWFHLIPANAQQRLLAASPLLPPWEIKGPPEAYPWKHVPPPIRYRDP